MKHPNNSNEMQMYPKEKNKEKKLNEINLDNIKLNRPADPICLGKIVKTQGINGKVRINSYTENILDIKNYAPLWAEPDNQYINLIEIKKQKNQIIANVEGIENIEQAEKIIGATLWVDRQKLQKINLDDCWYYHDLIKLKVYDEKKNLIGEVVDVKNFGASDILEIQEHSKNKQTILVPLKKIFVDEICIEKKYITLKTEI